MSASVHPCTLPHHLCTWGNGTETVPYRVFHFHRILRNYVRSPVSSGKIHWGGVGRVAWFLVSGRLLDFKDIIKAGPAWGRLSPSGEDRQFFDRGLNGTEAVHYGEFGAEGRTARRPFTTGCLVQGVERHGGRSLRGAWGRGIIRLRGGVFSIQGCSARRHRLVAAHRNHHGAALRSERPREDHLV